MLTDDAKGMTGLETEITRFEPDSRTLSIGTGMLKEANWGNF